MKKQIMGIGIIGIFLLAGITTAFERSENITTKETMPNRSVICSKNTLERCEKGSRIDFY